MFIFRRNETFTKRYEVLVSLVSKFNTSIPTPHMFPDSLKLIQITPLNARIHINSVKQLQNSNKNADVTNRTNTVKHKQKLGTIKTTNN